MVLYSNYLSGRSEDLFQFPLEYRPERWLKEDLGKIILLLVFRLESVLVCALVSSFLNSSLKIILELEKRFDLLFSALL